MEHLDERRSMPAADERVRKSNCDAPVAAMIRARPCSPIARRSAAAAWSAAARQGGAIGKVLICT
jgi:hypothetical protein